MWIWETHDVEAPDEQFIQNYDQGEGDHGDDREFEQDVHVPGYNVPAGAKDNRLTACVLHL